MLARMADHIHAHGALAGLELCYNGPHGPNFYSREVPMAPTGTHHRELHLRTPPGAHHGQGGHPQRPPLAQGGGASRQASGLRPDLCVCRPRAELPASLPLQGVQSPHRRIRRITREPRAAPQGAPDRHQGSGGRQLRRSLSPLDGRASQRGRAGEGRDRGHDRARRGDSGPLGRLPRRLGERQPVVPLRRGGRAGTLHRRRQEAHHEAGRRRRPLYVAGPHGLHRQEGHRRSDRLRAALHRRPLPPAKGGRGAPRGHPRVYRLQHLRLGRFHHVAHPLHPEPDHGGGMAPGLASRVHPAQGEREACPHRRRRPGRPRSRAGARQARLRGDPGGTEQRAGRAGRARMPSARPRRLGPGAGLPHRAASEASQRRPLSGISTRCGDRSRIRLPPRCDRHRRALAAATGSATTGPRPCPSRTERRS